MSDVYLVIDIATTCDELSTYINKDATELIELVWVALDALTLEKIHEDCVLVKPTNTPITPYCARKFGISWEKIRLAGSFRDAVTKFDLWVQSHLQGLDFSFVTVDISKLTVQIPREARDKLVVLPPYLQHPRVFELSSEYTKWQLTHPEALLYSGNLLQNIVTALEVMLTDDELALLKLALAQAMQLNRLELEDGSVENLSSSTGNLANSTGNLASSIVSSSTSGESPELEEQQQQQQQPLNSIVERYASIYSKTLAQIALKSLPLDAHPTVLTLPLDSSQDIKAFLAERLKILYLQNLPHDTTQSELELWFSQYGGRPIAFWTLKSVDNEKKKQISGFAVFATHEEATESLLMNGRLLNDRAVEVQTLSTKVLDKAHELLTPFPQLKNRPRPGDWTCPSCGFSNFQRRTACFRCSFPATSAVTIQELLYAPKRSTPDPKPYDSRFGNNVPFRAGDWKCEMCFYHNFAKNMSCLKCGIGKPNSLVNNTAAAIAAATASGSHGQYMMQTTSQGQGHGQGPQGHQGHQGRQGNNGSNGAKHRANGQNKYGKMRGNAQQYWQEPSQGHQGHQGHHVGHVGGQAPHQNGHNLGPKLMYPHLASNSPGMYGYIDLASTLSRLVPDDMNGLFGQIQSFNLNG